MRTGTGTDSGDEPLWILLVTETSQHEATFLVLKKTT